MNRVKDGNIDIHVDADASIGCVSALFGSFIGFEKCTQGISNPRKYFFLPVFNEKSRFEPKLG
jgi:hypothetical protein